MACKNKSPFSAAKTRVVFKGGQLQQFLLQQEVLGRDDSGFKGGLQREHSSIKHAGSFLVGVPRLPQSPCPSCNNARKRSSCHKGKRERKERLSLPA